MLVQDTRPAAPPPRPAAPPPPPDARGHREVGDDLHLGYRALAAEVIRQAIRDAGSASRSTEARVDRRRARAFLLEGLYRTPWWEWVSAVLDRDQIIRHVATLDAPASASRRRTARRERTMAYAR
jgi:hypothetical protein